jgi:hypothetical protein
MSNYHLSPSEGIYPSDLIHRRVYRIHSRNLVVGVWNKTTEGFVGIRTKFNDSYLFTEYEWTLQKGTAYAIELLPLILPDDLSLQERFGILD